MSPLDLVVLLPARNAEHHLPDWFASVERVADAVVALDDGSTDRTGELLDAHPLVTQLLRNPRRETYHGWDDAGNRNRLLEAAAALAPRWILSLDADERLPADDAAALRRHVLAHDGDPSLGYLVQVHRMVDDDRTWDRNELWVGRLFAHRPGQRFPDDRLHFVALPVGIGPRDHRRTTVRVQHLASLTEAHRRRRFDKYRQSDPDLEFQSSYDDLLAPPVVRRAWTPRPPRLPVVAHRADDTPPATPSAAARAAPALSLVVICQDDLDRIPAVLDAVAAQEVDGPVQTILVDSGTDGTADWVRANHPWVEVVHSSVPLTPGAARNAGLARATGEVVSFPGSHVRLRPDALQHRLDRHAEGWAMVTGSVENGVPTWAGWANYLLDHNGKLPGRPGGRLRQFPATASYLRAPLVAAGGFPDLRDGEDTSVNLTLWELGYGACREPRSVLVHDTPCRDPSILLRHHARRGRGLAHLLARADADDGLWTRAGLRQFGPRYPAGRLRRIHGNVVAYADGALLRRFWTCLPLVVAAVVAHWVTGWRAYLGALDAERRATIARRAWRALRRVGQRRSDAS